MRDGPATVTSNNEGGARPGGLRAGAIRKAVHGALLTFQSPRVERWVLIVAIIMGVAERAIWAWLRPVGSTAGEAHNIAVAIASGRGFADAFRPGQGPTDHLAPTMPVFAGGVYALFGINSPTAELILWAASVGLAIASYFIFYRAFARLGAPQWARLATFCFLCTAPTYMGLEASNFRVWAGTLVTCLTAIFFNALLGTRERLPLRTGRLVGMSVLAAVAFFANPPIGVGIFATAGAFCLMNLRGWAFAKALLFATVALGLVLGGWGLRNEAVMGKFMPMRDNAGLELALAQYDGALAPIDGAKRREMRFWQIHPLGPAYERLKAVGEVAYSENLSRETRRWMRDHPAQVARIMVMHLGQIVTPPPWVFELSQRGKLASFRSLLASLVGIFGFLGIAAGLWVRPKAWCYPALLVIGPVLTFIVFQPLARYLYLFYAPLAFSATGLIVAAAHLNSGQRSVAVGLKPPRGAVEGPSNGRTCKRRSN
jgi:hypothetical protein